MLPTYPAVLRDGVLDWGPGGPPTLPPEVPVPVHVTLLTSPNPDQVAGPAMASALAAIAASGGPAGFDEPVAWQRETRDERALPGRSD